MKRLDFLDKRFLALMNDIGVLGHLAHPIDPLLTGDRARRVKRHTRESLLSHAHQHVADYEAGIPHDHFGDLEHQLAAAAFNLLMEVYFSRGE